MRTLPEGISKKQSHEAQQLADNPEAIREYSDLLVIESNRYRKKSSWEELNEAEAREKILSEQALEREKAGKKIDPVQNSSLGKTRDHVAKAIGTSHDTLHKKKVISEKKPELLDEIDFGKRSVNSVYNQILKEEQKEQRKQNKALPFPEGKYRTIVIDPPWPVEKIIREERPNHRKRPKQRDSS